MANAVVSGSRATASVMSRLALTRSLVARLTKGEAVVAGIGNTNFDLFAAGQRPENFYMLGSMGLAFPIALGVALAQPDRFVVGLEGDGSLLMDLGCLATIAWSAPRNLLMIVWDNGSYQITGGQPAASSAVADLVAIARGAGIMRASWAADQADFERLVSDALRTAGPTLIACRVEAVDAKPIPERDPVLHKHRFMQALRTLSE